MDLQNMQNQNLILSTDAKPRLKWTPELHHRFVQAVSQLGGIENATPKSLMRAMGVPGLTLYHLKSHLQKYRVGKSQIMESSVGNKQEDCSEIQSDGGAALDEINESLEKQMEVQKMLHEQIKVQRRLQQRIEAQGKYLESVLKKAQETLTGYNSSSLGVEQARAELARLASMVSSGYTSSSSSGLTEIERHRELRGALCSVESSVTSSETSSACVELPLMERKRSGSTLCEDHCVEQPSGKRVFGWSGVIDLNSKYSE